MPKREYYYYFKPSSGTYQNQKRQCVEVTKFADDDDLPLQTYHVWQMHGDYKKCDCPANYRKEAPKECKHCKLVRDWERLPPQPEGNKSGHYFSTADEQFHEIPF